MKTKSMKEAMAEWSKAADCKSVRKLALVRIQLVSQLWILEVP